MRKQSSLPWSGGLRALANPYLISLMLASAPGWLATPAYAIVGPELQVPAVISGGVNHGNAANLTKEGLGQLRLSGNNTFQGNLNINAGAVIAGNANAMGTTLSGTFVNNGGQLILEGGIAVAGEYIALDSTNSPALESRGGINTMSGAIYVHSLGLYDINGQQENTDYLELDGNGAVQTGAGYLSLKTGAPIAVYPGLNTSATITGNLSLDPGNHVFTVASGGANDLVVNALISEYSTAAAIQKEGPGRMRLTANNTYTGSTLANAGTLQVDGSQPQSPVQIHGGTLQGIGTVGQILFTGTSGAIAPGDSPGMLTCNNSLALGGGSGTLQVELNGTTPASGYDVLSVIGTVNLSGVSLNASLGFASSPGDQFTIISNDGTDLISGTFTALPQGKKLYIGKELFQISYTGGSGNDVTLSRLVTPPPPTLTIESVPPSSVRLLWPTNDPPFALQTATNLPSTNWIAAVPLPVILGTNNVVTNSTAAMQGFYRLSNP